MCSEVTAMSVIIILNKMLCWRVRKIIAKDTCIVCGIKYIKLDSACIQQCPHEDRKSTPSFPLDFWYLLLHVVSQIPPAQKATWDITLLFQPQYRP